MYDVSWLLFGCISQHVQVLLLQDSLLWLQVHTSAGI